MPATTGMIAGMYHAWAAFRDSNGYPMGQDSTPDTKTAPSTLSPYKIPGIVEIGAPEMAVEVATRKAGQTIKGKRVLGISDIGSYPMTLSDYDETLHAMVTASLVDTTTMSGWTMTSPNSRNARRPQLIMGFSVGFTADDGSDQMMTWIYHNLQVSPALPGGSQKSGENPNPLQFSLTPSSSQRTGIGRLYSAMGFDVVEDSDICIAIRHTDAIFVTTFIKDAVATSFTLPYLPTSNDATGAANNSITNNGATLAVTSVSTSTGLVTLTAAGVANDIVVMAFPTRYLTP